MHDREPHLPVMTLPAVDEARTPAMRESRRWVAGLWVVAVVFALVGLARSIQVGVPYRDPHATYFFSKIVETAVVFVVVVLLEGIVRAGRPFSVRRIVHGIRARWTPRRLGLAWAALLAYHVVYIVYRNLKSWLAFRTQHDQTLQSWDTWLFGGHSPAVLLHDLLGEHAAARILTAWYGAFPPLVVIAFPAAVVLARRMRDAYVSIAAMMWIWILGTATYYAIPTLGPFHVAPQEFAGVSDASIKASQAHLLVERSQLLAHPGAPDSFAAVAAFASLHVGVTATILGIAWWNRLRRTTIVLAVFLVGTIVATIYLGYHFAVDDIAGLAIAALSWWLAPRTVGVRREPAPTEPELAAPV